MEEENITQERVFFTLASCLLKMIVSGANISIQQLESLNKSLSYSLKSDLSFWMKRGRSALEYCIKEVEHAEDKIESKLQAQKDVIRREATKNSIPVLGGSNQVDEVDTSVEELVEQLEFLLNNLKDRKNDLAEIIASGKK